MKKDFKKLYTKILIDKNYNSKSIELKLKKSNIDTTIYNLYQVKSAILYLSRNESEIESTVNNTNNDVESILSAATVKGERA